MNEINSKFQIPNSKSGFTLIELLVVISIIGILATLMISRYGMAEKSARDAERKSDLNQYRIALENYAVKAGGVYPAYPTVVDPSNPTGLCGKLQPNYLSACPQDPRYEIGGIYIYQYLSDGTTVGENEATHYILYARTETGSGSTTNFWYVCSDGRVGEKADSGTPAKGDCGF